jgi:pancreatic lipase-related protein 2
MNLIGFSLGAQILARSARFVRSTTGNRHIVGRLTGLDPWALGPINTITIGRLNSGDAAYVESIHTEGNQRGDLGSTGHVSFIVNGGVEQPMCTQVSPIARWDCSHIFSVLIWAESVRSTTLTFPALSCSSWDAFIGEQCNSNSVGHMGRTTNPTQGSYMLRTNLNRPFSRNTPFP